MENVTDRPPGAWTLQRIRPLVLYVRERGIMVSQAWVLRDRALAIRFENRLAQAQTLEGLLLSWPGVGFVAQVGAGLTYAYSAEPIMRASRRPGVRRVLQRGGERRG